MELTENGKRAMAGTSLPIGAETLKKTATILAAVTLLAGCSGSEPEQAADNDGVEVDAQAELGPLDTADGVAFASLTGDPAAGERAFAQCRSCHSLDPGANRVGPSLAGVVGSPAGGVNGYKYSPANRNSDLVWTPEQLYSFIEKPQRVMPGTKMIFPGIPDAQRRANIVAYLGTAD